MTENCIFCKIAAGSAPAEIVFHDDLVTAFKDTRPLAPVHLLVIPNRHIGSITDAAPQDEPLIGHMHLVAARLAAEHGIAGTGFRLMINTGPHAGQSVFHLHLHVLGGRHLPLRFD